MTKDQKHHKHKPKVIRQNGYGLRVKLLEWAT